jgi:CarD family transcriptional regulator
MRELGEFVICRSGGIWQVVGLDAGSVRLLQHGGTGGEVKVLPACDGEIVRKIVSQEAILEVIGRIGFIRTILAPNDKVRDELYQDAMAKFDEVEWIKVIKTAYLRGQEKWLTAAEIAYKKQAENYLHGEISVLLKMPLDAVEGFITASVSSDAW